MNYDNIEMLGDSTIRFILRKNGINPLITLGINPSTADNIKPDRTIRKTMGFADRLGYDSFVMLNIYPFRCTDPNNLPETMDNYLFEKNLAIIMAFFKSINSPTILLAYGDAIMRRAYLHNCLNRIFQELKLYNTTYFHLGNLTQCGNPRHLCRLPYDSKKYPFII